MMCYQLHDKYCLSSTNAEINLQLRIHTLIPLSDLGSKIPQKGRKLGKNKNQGYSKTRKSFAHINGL